MKKYLEIGVILVIILITFTPIINAMNLSITDLIKINKDNSQNESQVSNMGLDISIVDVIPYIWYPNNSQIGQLRLSLEIKNIGDTSYFGWVKYYGNASFFINNKFYSYAWGVRWGYFNPGVTWSPKAGHGLLFVNHIPRIFYIEFEITPKDSNMENNRIEQVYLVWGNRLFPIWRHLPLLELFPKT